MIKLNGVVIEQGRFPDGTLALKEIDRNIIYGDNVINWITWLYDSDNEMFTIMSLVDVIKRNSNGRLLYLQMPYLPNARMDRIKSNNENFALKVFTNWLNNLGFDLVIVDNVHSNVSNALVNNIADYLPENDINDISIKYNFDVIFFPDEGACKRYKDMNIIKELGLPIAFGIKNRDWKTGDIISLDIMGADVRDKNVLIIDDICSKGYTFYHSGKKLKEFGASDVRLYITHCEDNIKNGLILISDVISKVYTTDSICHIEDEKIEFVRKFRD